MLQGWPHPSTWATLVPMEAQMGDTAVNPAIGDAGTEPEFRPTVRERLGIVGFIVVAVTATIAWVSLLAWGILQLIQAL